MYRDREWMMRKICKVEILAYKRKQAKGVFRFVCYAAALLCAMLFTTVSAQTRVAVRSDTDSTCRAGIEIWNSYPDGRVRLVLEQDSTGSVDVQGLEDPYDMRVYSQWHYPAVFSHGDIPDTVVLEKTPEFYRSDVYMEVWSSRSFFHGYPLQQGDIITAMDPDGVVCGVTNAFYFDQENTNGFSFSIFGDSKKIDNGIDEGAEPGDTIRFFINKEEAIIRRGSSVWNWTVRRIELNQPGIVSIDTKVLPDEAWGTIHVTPDTNRIPYGLNVLLKAEPAFGYKFVHWGNAMLDTSRIAEFFITGDTLVTGYFAELSALPLHMRTYPADGFRSVPVNIPLHVNIIDQLYGVDLSTIQMSVNDDPVIQNGSSLVPGYVRIQPVADGYTAVYTPETPFQQGEAVHISVSAQSSRNINPRSITDAYTFVTGNTAVGAAAAFPVSASMEVRPGFTPLSILFHENGQDTDSIYVFETLNPPQLPDSLRPAGTALCFTPFGYAPAGGFGVRVHVSDSLLNACGAHDPSHLHLMTFIPETGMWQEADAEEYNAVESTVSYTAEVLSYMQLAVFRPVDEQNSSSEKQVLYNYPNPFNPAESVTYIRYTAAQQGTYTLTITDVAGHVVAVPHADKQCSPGVFYQTVWDGRDRTGAFVANNVYFCVLQGPGSQRKIRKIAVIR